jgi:hypothetical protein
MSIIEPCHCGFTSVFMYPFCPNSALLSSNSNKYPPPWCPFIFSRVTLILHSTLCIHPIRLSKRMSSPIAPRINSFWKFLPQWALSSLKLEFEKVLFHFEHLIELMDQEDRVMEHNTRRVMKYNPILQGAISFMHRSKSCMGNQELFLLSVVPISSFLCSQCSFHRFLCPLLRKS